MKFKLYFYTLLSIMAPLLNAETHKALVLNENMQHHERLFKQAQLEQVRRAKDAYLSEDLALERQTFDRLTEREKSKVQKNFFEESYADLLIDSAPYLIKDIINDYKLSLNIKKKSYKEAQKPTAILLVGPPGAGKSYLARAIPQKMGVPFVFIDCGHLGNELQYSQTANLRRAIKEAENYNAEYIVVVLDEIQGLTDKEKNKNNFQDSSFSFAGLLSEYENNKKICFIATANSSQDLPDSIKSRFEQDYVIRVDLPNNATKEKALKFHLKDLIDDNLIDEKQIPEILRKTPNFSLRDYKGLSSKLITLVNRDIKKLTLEDIKSAISIMLINKQNNAIGWMKQAENFCKDHYYTFAIAGTLAGVGISAASGAYLAYNSYLSRKAAIEAAEAAKIAAQNAVNIAPALSTVASTATNVTQASSNATTYLNTVMLLPGAPVFIIGLPALAGGALIYYLWPKKNKSANENKRQ